MSDTPPLFTFAQIDAALADIHSIAPQHRQAFAARLKQLARIGLLSEGAGRGRTRLHTIEEAIKYGLALEFVQGGVRAEYTVRAVNDTWALLWHQLQRLAETDEFPSVVAVFDLGSLSALMSEPHEFVRVRFNLAAMPIRRGFAVSLNGLRSAMLVALERYSKVPARAGHLAMKREPPSDPFEDGSYRLSLHHHRV